MSIQRTLLPVTLVCFAVASADAQTRPGGLSYPPTRKGTQVDVYHGTSVADPYRWLEDTDSPETKAWVAAQNRVTFGYLNSIPERGAIRARLEKVWNYPKYEVPNKQGDNYFFTENSGLLNQSILFVREGGKPARVLIDPNTLSTNGTVALSVIRPSPNGNTLAYAVSAAGSDWQEIRLRNVENGRDARDTLKWVKFSDISWTRDNKGFFYEGYDPQTSGNKLTNVVRNQRVYYHRVGQPQSQDQIIFEQSDQPDWLYDTQVSDDGHFAVITVYQGTDSRTRLYAIDLANAKKPTINAPVLRLIDRFESENYFVGNMGDFFVIRTDRRAPKGQIVQVDINDPEPTRWISVVPEAADVLQSATIGGDQLILSYLQDAHSSVRVYGMPNLTDPRRNRPNIGPGSAPPMVTGPRATANGADRRRMSAPGYPFIAEIALPSLGTVGQISAHENDNEMFYSFSSFLAPTSIYRYDLKRHTSSVYKAPTLPIDASQFETRQVFFNSRDGTRVPMFITMKKGTVLNGANPTILYGYGGFNVAETPSFSAANLVWLEMGGIYAVANIRGGSEYGKDWHEGGMLLKKQNVFDDFIAAAEYLIREKYTSTPKLAISGGSNGGLLVGAVLNQRPDLFGAALPAVGVMDMLRFQKFTIGWAWVSDYGSSDDATQFAALLKYSPLHNIKPGTQYPATLITTADHDDRVVPGHSFKYAATLQAAQAGPAPILIRIETDAGHGAGKPTSKRIDEAADRFAFLVKTFGMHVALQ
jgi:prolyl oligopeptidase